MSEHRTPAFAPNNNHAARALFTGRTSDCQAIIQCLLAGECVGLFAERRGGKTLTLEMLEAIINGSIDEILEQLIDQRFRASIAAWRELLAGYRAVLVSLQGMRWEHELAAAIRHASAPLGLLIPGPGLDGGTPAARKKAQESERLGEVLSAVKLEAKEHGLRLALMIDEMEVLSRFHDGDSVAEVLSDRLSHADLVFVHAGSYEWRDRVEGAGSLFTHLHRIYLGPLPQTDVVDYLFEPLAGNPLRNQAMIWSGGKPLYAQLIGAQFLSLNRAPSAQELLSNNNLTTQLKDNIFSERGLNDKSKRILCALAHHRNVRTKWLAKRLGFGEADTTSMLDTLVRFGTATVENGRYRLVGDLVELYGKRAFEDPARSNVSLSRRLKPFSPWIVTAGLLGAAIGSYNYENPGTNEQRFHVENGVVTIDVPKSLEDGESGKLSLRLLNTGSDAIENTKLILDSDSIRVQKDGVNSYTFDRVNPGETKSGSLDYEVHSVNRSTLPLSVRAGDMEVLNIGVPERPLPLKKQSSWILAAMTVLSGFLPKPIREPLTSLVKQQFKSGE